VHISLPALCLLCLLVLLLVLVLQRQRSHEKHDFFKKTRRGQPVMKYRVDKILAALQQDAAAKH
jgi:uncharacterized membrane protein